MGKKIFVSYKYHDDNVLPLNGIYSTVRDYVDAFEEKLDDSDNIYKGEEDGEDLSQLTDDQIWEKLKDRIYDSSVTVIFISPNMKENYKSERDQWIPWEVSYSLKETSRKNKNGDTITSRTNAMVAVVLPDRNGSYQYYLEDRNCCSSRCRMHHTYKLFEIIRENKFNYNDANKRKCSQGDIIYHGTCSYIEAVKWKDFISNYQYYIKRACDRQDDVDHYELHKDVE